MALSLKDGVRFTDVSHHIIAVLPVIERIYRSLGQNCVITSCRDGRHMAGSKHYTGEAIDLRTHYFNALEKADVLQCLQHALGPDFDVVLESDHLHVEYDP